jgi:putative ABC transport system substrate-binding protein
MILLFTACSLVAPTSASVTVAHVVGFDLPDDRDYQMQIRDALRKDGWIDGQNLVLEWHLSAPAAGIEEWLPAVEAEAVHGRPVMLFTSYTPYALALKKATSTVPVVVSIGDPVTIGLVSSYAHPGGNVTGVSTNPFSQFGKRVEILKEVLPNVRHLGALYTDPANPNLPAQLEAFDSAARQLGMDMVAVQAGKHVEEFDAAFEAFDRAQVDALYVVQDAVTLDHQTELAALATQHRMAMLCARSFWVQSGCLMSYGSQASAVYVLKANYIDRVLRGARPGDLPIQLPTVFDLSINVKTLQALGLTIEPAALPLVTEWIQ